ncbi:MAG TPA: hypothetical protein VIY47_05415, partial [Ignavibacteriaceae bacterium]
MHSTANKIFEFYKENHQNSDPKKLDQILPDFYQLNATDAFNSDRLFHKIWGLSNNEQRFEILTKIPEEWLPTLWHNTSLITSIFHSVGSLKSADFWEKRILENENIPDSSKFFGSLDLLYNGALLPSLDKKILDIGINVMSSHQGYHNQVLNRPGMVWVKEILELAERANQQKNPAIDQIIINCVKRYKGDASGRDVFDFPEMINKYPWTASPEMYQVFQGHHDWKNADFCRKSLGITQTSWATTMAAMLKEEVDISMRGLDNKFYDYIFEAPIEDMKEWMPKFIEIVHSWSQYLTDPTLSDYKNPLYRADERYSGFLTSIGIASLRSGETFTQFEHICRPDTNPLLKPGNMIRLVLAHHDAFLHEEISDLAKFRTNELLRKTTQYIDAVDDKRLIYDFAKDAVAAGKSVEWLAETTSTLLRDFIALKTDGNPSHISDFVKYLSEDRQIDLLTAWTAISGPSPYHTEIMAGMAVLLDDKGSRKRKDGKGYYSNFFRELKEINPKDYGKSMKREWTDQDKIIYILTGSEKNIDTYKVARDALGNPNGPLEKFKML